MEQTVQSLYNPSEHISESGVRRAVDVTRPRFASARFHALCSLGKRFCRSSLPSIVCGRIGQNERTDSTPWRGRASLPDDVLML